MLHSSVPPIPVPKNYQKECSLIYPAFSFRSASNFVYLSDSPIIHAENMKFQDRVGKLVSKMNVQEMFSLTCIVKEQAPSVICTASGDSRELTMLGREPQLRLHKTKTAVTEIKIL